MPLPPLDAVLRLHPPPLTMKIASSERNMATPKLLFLRRMRHLGAISIKRMLSWRFMSLTPREDSLSLTMSQRPLRAATSQTLPKKGPRPDLNPLEIRNQQIAPTQRESTTVALQVLTFRRRWRQVEGEADRICPCWKQSSVTVNTQNTTGAGPLSMVRVPTTLTPRALPGSMETSFCLLKS